MSIVNTPQGDIKSAYGFDTNRLFCKYNVRVGYNWTLLSGKDTGETYEEIKDETEGCVIWDNPFDIHYKAKTMRGWPKFYLEVWQVDDDGRYSISGYGIGVVPFTPGQHTIQVKCWRPRPQGFFKRLAARILGIQPELEFKDMVMSSAERFGFEAESTGTVEIDIGVIVKDFQLHGVALKLNLMGCCEARPDAPNALQKFDKVHFDDEKLKLLINNSFIEVHDEEENDLFGDSISPLAKASPRKYTEKPPSQLQSGRNSARRLDPMRLSTQSTPDDKVSYNNLANRNTQYSSGVTFASPHSQATHVSDRNAKFSQSRQQIPKVMKSHLPETNVFAELEQPMDQSHKFKTTTAVTISVNVQKLSKDSGFCEIIEKRVKKRDLIKLQKKKERQQEKERKTVADGQNLLEQISSFNNTETFVRDQRKTIGQQILDNYFPTETRGNGRPLSPILFEAEDSMTEKQVEELEFTDSIHNVKPLHQEEQQLTPYQGLFKGRQNLRGLKH